MPPFNCPIIRFSGVIYEKLIRHERYVFMLFLVITLLQLWLTKYVPSLDGPQHLYNATVLANLVKGNELVKLFFTVNDTIVGYWTAHALLAFFTVFLPSWLAEKLFLTLYVLGMVFAFRYLVKSINPSRGNFVAYLIFPFVYHMFILMGYYAFSFAAIFYFLGFGYYVRHRETFSWKQMLVFGLLLVLLFLTHGLVYILFLLSIGLFVLVTAAGRFFSSPEPGWFRGRMNVGIRIILAAIPSFVLWILYIRTVISLDNTVAGAGESLGELVRYLARIRQLVGFHHELEAIGYIPVFILLVLLTIVFIVLFAGGLKDRTTHWNELFSMKNSWMILALFFLALYFFAPNRISAGSLTHRFGLYFFLLVVTWLSMQKWPKTFQVLTVIVVLFSITYARTTQHRFYVRLNKDIRDLTELTDYMEANSVVDYRLKSNNWTHIHFPLYAALDKPLVHLRNVQCWGQFPMVWNYDDIPRTYAGDRPVRPSGAVEISKDHPIRQIDYITVFYVDRFWNDSTEAEWHTVLSEDYEEVHVSELGRAGLYARKK